MDYDDFQNATYFEVFLDGIPPDGKVSRSQVFVIATLSDNPQIAVPTEQELAAEWAEFDSAGAVVDTSRETPGLVRGPIRQLFNWVRRQ